MARIIMRLAIAATVLAAATYFNVPASRAAVADGPWCARINLDDYLNEHCGYRTFEECRSATAGDRGLCNLDSAPGLSMPLPRPRH
jgi:uncharacterized protein DUF3551